MENKKLTLQSLLVIALPMIVSQASETIMMFADRLFLSRLGKEFMSGAMSGGLTFFTVVSLFGGIVGYSNALVAQYYGAKNLSQCSQSTNQAIYLSGFMYPVLFISIPLVYLFFKIVGHSPEQLVMEFSYFRILMYGSILFLLRNSLTGFFLGIGKTKVVMFANLAGMFVNIPINYVLIFGKYGFPSLGIEGAAIGTLIGSFMIFLIQLMVFFSKKYRKNYGTGHNFQLRLDLLRKLLKFGTPAGLETFLNVGAFNIFIQLMYSYSADIAAAVTITFNYDMVAFIPMIGLSFATTSIIAQQIGAKDPEGARLGVKLAMRIGLSYAIVMMGFFIFAAGPLVRVFTHGLPGDSSVIESTAVILLRLASLYTMGDVTQLVFAGALRGAGDTRFVMKASVLIHWIFAGISFLLIKVLVVSPILMWIFMIIFVLSIGFVLVLRFRSGKWEKIKLI
ncbi:MAG: MATE family efflux transporter [Spirochaetaceae bacterium]|nr:MATE family efflux transporter [Spirochaetaceae bacterium]